MFCSFTPAVSKLALNAMRATIKDLKIRKRTEVTPDDIVREISRWFGDGSLIIGGIRTRGYNVDRRCARTPFTICKAGTKKRHIRPNKELERLNYKFLQIHNISMTSKLDPTPPGNGKPLRRSPRNSTCQRQLIVSDEMRPLFGLEKEVYRVRNPAFPTFPL
jgi:hypothetical protein